MATGAAVLGLWLFMYGGHGIGVSGTITASYASGAADGGDGNSDEVGGLVGRNTSSGTITASYATGMADGGDGGDVIGGLVGRNIGTITASYASGDVDGGDGNSDTVGGLVGNNSGRVFQGSSLVTVTGTIMASYGFGTESRWRGNN